MEQNSTCLLPSLFSMFCRVREQSTSPSSFPAPIVSVEVTKTLFIFDNVLEGPTALTVCFYMLLSFCYSQRLQMKISQGKDTWDTSPGKFQTRGLQLSSLGGILGSTDSLSYDVQHCVQSLANQGRSSPGPWCPEFFLGLDYIDCPWAWLQLPVPWYTELISHHPKPLPQ